MTKIKVAPSILSGDFANMGKSVKMVKSFGADYIHFDVMDGSFVPNITFGMPMLKAVKSYSKLPFDVHLMIVNPEKYVERFIDSGADIVTIHPDTTKDVVATLMLIKNKGAKCGLVVNPDVDVEVVVPYLDYIDMIVLMGVYPGFGGQKFIPEVLNKIISAKKIIKDSGKNIELELDGGVTASNVKSLTDAGVNVVVAGSAIFNAENPKQIVQIIKCKKIK
ncbi:MAG: ribulose-phosphate 3-epimerase [Clostridia bacterium]